ncbi:DUF480 domain-containing protein [Wenzhouxiangella sp. XN24]|uniref:YceH family protein n=1 Tax=Wenzhouxiangella sp. XN24 TaxID=2713569 RepID=UPI0013EBE35C|nr:DUF480 domain-containing protein [Wenzhouxiangella sp. XN24]NGX14868.1 DUF480 domain-containing protein [Wenzhouxiangella sp. XN24]
MRTELTPLEARVIGSLIEKEITTPDQYPLSLNALTAACNQKSNRDPVLELGSSEVQEILDGLMKKHLVTDRSGGVGGRVTRYRHRFCNTQFGNLHLEPAERAIICELLLRGAQTPGELRTRANRLAPLRDVSEVEQALRNMAGREEPLVVQLPRETGRRDCRWMQLFTGETPPPPAAARDDKMAAGSRNERLEILEGRVDSLQSELEELRRRIDALTGDTDPTARG